MAFRADIVAGKAVILVNIEDTIDKQLRSIRNKVFKFSNTLARVGGELTLFGGIGSAGALFPVKEFVNFQDQLLFTQTKLRATDAEMKVLEGTIRELGKSTSFTSIEVGKSAQRLAQAGFSMKEVQNALQASLDLARGGQVDLATSTDILSNSIRAYALNTTDASLVASKFITAARLGTLDIVDLNEALKNSATTFNLLGLNLDQSLALITRLSTASLRGTIAGTSLNRAFQKLAIENEKLARAGVAFTDEDFATPLGVLTKINQVVETLGKQESVGFLNDLVGIRGGRAVGGILIQGLGGLDDTVKEITASTVEARDAALKLDSALGGVYRRGLSGFQELLIAIGATTEGPLTAFGENLRLIFNNLSKLATTNPEFVQTLLVIPPLALAAGAGMLTLSFALSKVGLLLSPIIALNGALFASLQKIASVNIKGVGKALSLGLSPGRAVLAKVAAENAAFTKALDRISRATRQTDRTKGFQALGRAQRNRSILTTPLKLRRLLKGTTGPEVEAAAVKSAVKLSTVFTKAFEDNLLTGKKQGALTPIRGRGKAVEQLLGLEDGPIKAPKQLGFDFTDTTIKTNKASQLSLFNGIQDLFNFTENDGRNNITKGAVPRTSKGKFLAKNITKEIEEFIGLISKQKAYKGLGFNELIDQAFEVYDLSDVAKKSIRMKLFNGLRETNKSVQQQFDFRDQAPVQRLFDFEDAPVPKRTQPTQLDFDFKEAPKQMVFAFDDAVEKAAKATSTRKLSLAELRGEKYFAQTAKATRTSRRGLGATTIVGRLAKSFSGSAITGTVRGIRGLTLGLGGLLRPLTRFNYLRGTINVFAALGKGLRGLFAILNGARRFVFSFSGILTIIELLILFGPKIPPVAAALNALGKGFKGLFSELGAAIKGIGPGLSLLFNGIKELATGNTEAGLNRIKTAFAGIAEVISTGLTSAWQTFLTQIEKGANAIKDIFNGLLAAGSAIGAVASSVGSALFSGGTSERGFEFGDTIGNVVQAISTGLVSLIGGLGQVLIQIAEAIRNTVTQIKDLVVRIYNFVTGKGIFTGRDNLGDLDPNLSKRVATEEALARVLEAIRGTSTKNDPFGIKANRLNDLNQQRRILQAQLNFLGGSNVKSPAQQLRDSIGQILADLNEAFKPLQLDADTAQSDAQVARIKLGVKSFYMQMGDTIDSFKDRANQLFDVTKVPAGTDFIGSFLSQQLSKLPNLSLPSGSKIGAVAQDGLFSLLNGTFLELNDVGKKVRQNPLFDGTELSEIEGAGYKADGFLGRAAFGIGEAIGNLVAGTPNQPPQELGAAVSALENIASSLTGSFEQTRDQKLRISAVDKQEEANALLADIKDNTQGIKNAEFL